MLAGSQWCSVDFETINILCDDEVSGEQPCQSISKQSKFFLCWCTFMSVVIHVLYLCCFNVRLYSINHKFLNLGEGTNRGPWVGCRGSQGKGVIEYFNFYHNFWKLEKHWKKQALNGDPGLIFYWLWRLCYFQNKKWNYYITGRPWREKVWNPCHKHCSCLIIVKVSEKLSECPVFGSALSRHGVVCWSWVIRGCCRLSCLAVKDKRQYFETDKAFIANH